MIFLSCRGLDLEIIIHNPLWFTVHILNAIWLEYMWFHLKFTINHNNNLTSGNCQTLPQCGNEGVVLYELHSHSRDVKR